MKPTHEERENWRTEKDNWIGENQDKIILLAWGIFIGFLLSTVMADVDFPTHNFWHRFGPSALSIFITTVVVGLLNYYRARWQHKQRLIHEMGSRVRAIALYAVEELRKEKWLINGALQGIYLQGARLNNMESLDGIDLSNSRLEGVNFQKSNLSHAKFIESILDSDRHDRPFNVRHATLIGANFERAIIQFAQFQNADLSGANFANANTLDINFENSTLHLVNFRNAQLYGANLAQSFLSWTHFEGANLRYANLRGIKINVRVYFDARTILPNGDIWQKDYDLEIFTNPDHPNFYDPDEDD